MSESAPGEGDASADTRDANVKPSHKVQLLIKARETAREIAREELGDTDCHICGRSPIEIHHRNGDALDNRPINLIPLCRRHHRQAHRLTAIAADVAEWKASLPGD